MSRLLEYIEQTWKKKGKRPTDTDMMTKMGINKIQLYDAKEDLKNRCLLDGELRPQPNHYRRVQLINEAMKCRTNLQCTAYYSR